MIRITCSCILPLILVPLFSHTHARTSLAASLPHLLANDERDSESEGCSRSSERGRERHGDAGLRLVSGAFASADKSSSLREAIRLSHSPLMPLLLLLDLSRSRAASLDRRSGEQGSRGREIPVDAVEPLKMKSREGEADLRWRANQWRQECWLLQRLLLLLWSKRERICSCLQPF